MMKKLLLFIFASLFTANLSLAQQGFNYKAIIYDNGSALQNQNVDLQFSILENGTSNVYQETQTTTTDANGIVILNIGEGNVVSGDFSTIDWSQSQFLKVEVDTGSGYQLMGTTEFKYVPAAKFAEKAGNVFSGNFTDLIGTPTGLSDGDDDTQLTESQVDYYVANNGYLTSETDGDATNELQTINKTGSTVSLSNGGGSFTDADTHLTENQVDAYVANNGYVTQIDNIQGIPVSSSQPSNGQVLKFNGTAFVPATDDVSGSSGTDGVANSVAFSGNVTKTLTITRTNGLGNLTANFSDADTHLSETQVDSYVANNGYLTSETDGDTTNELQTISKTGNTVSLSNGGGSFTDADTHLTDANISAMGYIKNAADADNDPTNEIELPATAGNGQVLTWNGTGWVAQNVSASNDVDFLEVGTGSAPNSIMDNIYHTGNISIGQTTAPDAKMDIKNTGSSTASNANVGLKLYNNNSSATDKIGVDMELETSSSTAGLYGSKKTILASGDGDIYGDYTAIGMLNGDGEHYGSYYYMDGDGVGKHTGAKAYLFGNAQGQQIGFDADISLANNTNTSDIIGVKTHIRGLATGNKYGVTNLLDGDADGNLFGTENTISNSSDYPHYGTINRMIGTGSGNHYATSNIMTETGTGKQYAIRNYINNSGNNTHYGVYSNLKGSGSGQHIGAYNIIEGDGTGEQIANYNIVSNTGDANHYGNKNEMSGGGSGVHYGNYNKLSGAGTGKQYGTYNELSGSGNGLNYGAFYKISSTGSNLHIGSQTYMTGASTGSQVGFKSFIDNSGNSYHYGMTNVLNGSGSGQHTGVSNTLSGSGTGTQYGTKTNISNTGTGVHYGNYTEISGGSGAKYGAKTSINSTSSTSTDYGNHTTISGSGTGERYGSKTIISNSNNSRHYGNYVQLNGNGLGKHYGFYSNISGSGSESKLGVYAIIDSNAGGNHYAIYGEATRNTDNTYAGYFLGDAKITGKLKSEHSGTADMKAYIYGNIDGSNSSPSIIADGSSDGFSMTRLSAGYYKITMTNAAGSANSYIVIATVNNISNIWVTNKTINSFIIRMRQNAVDKDYDFQFVVYKR